MGQAQRQRVKELLFEAVALPPEAREDFLAEVCQKDEALYKEVVSLLAFHQDSETGGGEPPLASRAGLAPGTLFAGRYRIMERLGQGGMGVVYRAHDEVLEASVALKFLIASSEDNQQQLLTEVRLARQITHPNVCRVFDVGESEGEFFFTMEYVDGEDLSSQLRRFGRLPPAKVLDIARQLCSGLTAAHAKGVLHRDLKPANIMIDAQGRVRITDFGIAVLAGPAAASLGAGTPGYMAPEQLMVGGQVNERSDLYAVGLVLYELLTGSPVFDARDERGLLHQQLERVPQAPSWHVTGVPLLLDRIITRTLSPDPGLRPASALEMAAELGCSDVLAIASAAGLTPSPGVLVKADLAEGVSPSRAWLILALTAMALGVLIWLVNEHPPDLNEALTRAPEVLREQAKDIAAQLGYTASNEDDYGYLINPSAIKGEEAILFWLRWKEEAPSAAFVEGVLEASAPTTGLDPGKAGLEHVFVIISPSGQLAGFLAPPNTAQAPGDLDRVFELTRVSHWEVLEKIAEPPPMFATKQEFYRGFLPDKTPALLHLAWLEDQIVYVGVTRQDPDRQTFSEILHSQQAVMEGVALVVLSFFLLALPLAWQNFRRGRSDRVGAKRAATFVGLTAVASFVFSGAEASHPMLQESGSFLASLGLVSLNFVLSWIAYAGFEPAARRYWPGTLVGWTRLLYGKWRDPAVGSALLTGSCAGVFLALLNRAGLVIGNGEDPFRGVVVATSLNAVTDTWSLLSAISERFRHAAYQGMVLLLILVLVRYVMRLKAPSIAIYVAFIALPVIISLPEKTPALVVAALFVPLTWTFLLIRRGLLTLGVCIFINGLFEFFLLDSDLDAWYGAGLEASLFILLTFSIGGARLATRSRSSNLEERC